MSSNSLNIYEKYIGENQSPLCNNFIEKNDLVFFYSNMVYEESYAYEIANTLQQIYDYSKFITNLKPTQYFCNSRVIIRWLKDQNKRGDARWKSEPDRKGHWINLSWDYMTMEDEPLKICSHELVHPFYRVSTLHTKGNIWGGNEGWGEGFCDFLRGPIFNHIGLEGNQGERWWNKMIYAFETNNNGIYHFPAGQFVLYYLNFCKTDKNSLNKFINDQYAIRKFVKFLFEEFAERPLTSVFKTTPAMEEKYRSEGKI